ncbi:MAG: tripartite tricarboxylate transporter permease [Corynebacterium flavescens]|nr:tripartite tricarboxylate transporter permease [Corynebacterium flavescens]
MAALGLWLASIGTDPIEGTQRFSFGFVWLYDGLGLVAVAMGLFGVAELLQNIEATAPVVKVKTKLKDLIPTKADFKQSYGAMARGSVLGFFIGVLPGGGGVLSSMASYAAEKRISKTPERFGKGAMEGIAGPEAANNASSTAAFIPLLTLGIPPNVVLALIYGALLIQGITPSPSLVSEHPEVFWGVIASIYIGNVMLLILNLPLVGIFVRILKIRPGILSGVALLIVLAGAYSVNNDFVDMVIVIVFGLIGWLMKKTGFDPGPLVLAFVLGPILEQAFRQSMLLSHGSAGIFLSRPISGTLIVVIMLMILLSVLVPLLKRRSAWKKLSREDQQKL